MTRCGTRRNFPAKEAKKLKGEILARRILYQQRAQNKLRRQFFAFVRETLLNRYKNEFQGKQLEEKVQHYLSLVTEEDYQEWVQLRKEKQEVVAAE